MFKTTYCRISPFWQTPFLLFFARATVTVVVTLTVMEILSGGRRIIVPTAATAATTANATSIHDLAVVGIEARMTVEVTAEAPSVTRSVLVGIQTRSDHDESIDENIHLGNGVTTGLVRLKVTVIDGDNEGCQPAKVVVTRRPLLAGGPKHRLPPKSFFSVGYEVTFRCTAAKPRDYKDPTPWNYSFSATVHHEVLDGNPDSDPSDDVCPREPIPPKRGIEDRGCGWKLRGQPFGPNVVDVVLKPPAKP